MKSFQLEFIAAFVSGIMLLPPPNVNVEVMANRLADISEQH